MHYYINNAVTDTLDIHQSDAIHSNRKLHKWMGQDYFIRHSSKFKTQVKACKRVFRSKFAHLSKIVYLQICVLNFILETKTL